MSRRRTILGSLLVLLLVGGAVVYWQLSSPPVIDQPLDEGNKEDLRRKILMGVWQDEFKGKRTMTLNDDGTATMLYVAKSGAFELHFDMRWQLEGDTFKNQSLGGKPALLVNGILKTMGNTAEYTILELTPDRLLLEDVKDKAKYDWKRVK